MKKIILLAALFMLTVLSPLTVNASPNPSTTHSVTSNIPGPGVTDRKSTNAYDGENRYVCYRWYYSAGGARKGTYVDRYVYDAWPSPRWVWVDGFYLQGVNAPNYCTTWSNVNLYG